MDQEQNEELTQTPPADPPAENTEGEQRQETPTWATKRLSEITAKRREAEARAEQMAQRVQQLEAERDSWRQQQLTGGEHQQIEQQTQRQYGHLPQEDIDAIINQRVEQRLKEQTQQSDFDQRVGDLNSKAEAEYGQEYASSVQNLQLAGVGGREFLDTLTGVDNPEKLIVWLGKDANIQEAMRLNELPPHRMGAEMQRLAMKAAKDMAKPKSKAPPPLDQVNGRANPTNGQEPDPKDTKAWMAWRKAKVAERGRR